ncbi:class I SAM-dependent methyltransferase [Nitrososphaera sp.]|uniref:class I SAM-dependent methyltransferase n=1 Tax=Nitrososphaera sp. TaxID=1971748 RepID=UPI002ED8F093
MNIGEFLSTLPQDIMKGGVEIPDRVLKKMFFIAGLRKGDVFCHLGCGSGNAVRLAAKLGVKKAIGVEPDGDLASAAKRKVARLKNAGITVADLRDADISSATVVLFWSSDLELVDALVKKFRRSLKEGARVITVWSPPGMMLPNKADFPFFVCKKPFRYATSVRQQIQAIYGTKCVDFTAAWRLAEKFIDELGVVPQEYRRFVNMLQGMVIWINAWNMGVACEDGVPPPVQSYLGILREFFQIDLSDMFTRGPKDESMVPDKMGCC